MQPPAIKSYGVQMKDGTDHCLPVERLPEGFALGNTFLINFWRFYSHMHHRTYPSIEALLDDACPGWQSYAERIPPKRMSAREETEIIKASLRGIGINARVRHYLGAIVVELGRTPEEGESRKLREEAARALGQPDRFAFGGFHVYDKFEGKTAAGWRRGDRRSMHY